MQEQQRETENAQFEETAKKIWQAIEQTSYLKGLEKNLLIDQTPEGLRIQVIDREGKPMYQSGSAIMLPRIKKPVAQIAVAIKSLPNESQNSGSYGFNPFQKPQERI